MQVFKRETIHAHYAEAEDVWPEFLGTVQIGEVFVMETEYSNAVNGPIAIEGIIDSIILKETHLTVEGGV